MIRQTFEELKATGHLPSPPGVGMRILKLTQDETHSSDEIARTIMADPALTGRLLKIANSAHVGGAEPVTTVAGATMRLGQRTVENVALGLSLVSSNRAATCARFDYDRFWSMALARAVAAQNISRCIQVGVPAECYALGLLSEIGYLALASIHPHEYAQVLEVAPEPHGLELARLERDHFEIDHNEVSSCMLEEWGLPPAFAQAVQVYESEDRIAQCESRDAMALAKLLRCAQAIARASIEPGGGSRIDARGVADRLEDVRRELTMDVGSFESMCATVAREWREWGDVLDVPLPKPSVAEANAPSSLGAAPTIADSVPPALSTADAERPLRILAVDDDNLSLRVLARTLMKSGHDVVTASNGNDALKIALETNPQVVIADWMMPELDGLNLCKALRRIESGRNMFFLLLTGRGEEDRIVEAFDAGVDDYIVKPFNSRVLMARIKGGQRVITLQERVENDRKMIMKQVAELGLMTRKLRNAALTDVLTELPNRRYAMKRLEADWEASSRTGNALSIIMIDIDHFKKVNDTYGHDVGDIVLKETANVLRASTRAVEEASRLGGEEFLVICPNTNEAQAAICAERLRAAVEANVIQNPAFHGHVTISLGVAERTPATLNYDALIKAADEAVYAAKSGGRNRHHLASTQWNRAKSA